MGIVAQIVIAGIMVLVISFFINLFFLNYGHRHKMKKIKKRAKALVKMIEEDQKVFKENLKE